MSLSLSGDGTVTGVTAIGDVSSTELGYLDGVTSALQTQINTKADASTQGLVLIDEESFSAVSSVSLNNVFSATYANYRVILNVPSVSTSSQLRLRYRLSGTDTTTNYRWTRVEASTQPSGPGNEQGNSDLFVDLTFMETAGSAVIDIIGPQLAQRTFCSYQSARLGTYLYTVGGVGVQTDSTQFDGLTIYRASGTFTGTVRVYGYKGA